MKVKKCMIVVLALLFLMTAALSGCGGESGEDSGGSGAGENADGVRELRFSSMAVEGELAYDICRGIVDEINEKSDTVHVTFYPANQLGSFDTVFGELMRGTIDMAHCSLPDTYGPMPTCGLIPYMATSYEDMAKVLGEGSVIYNATSEALAELGLEFLGAQLDGITGIATTKDVKNPADPTKDKGVVIRSSATEVFKMGAECLGFRTSVLPSSETFTAMQSGVVDGCIAAPPSGSYLSYGDAFDHWYEYRCVAELTGLMFNSAILSSLSEDDQRIIREAFAAGAEESFIKSKEFNEEYLQTMKDEGYTVVEFTDEEMAVFAKNAREEWWPKLASTFGEDFFSELNEELEALGL